MGESGVGAMTHARCEHCHLRFTGEAETYLTACPECGRPTTQVSGAQGLLGYRLFDPSDLADVLPDGQGGAPARPQPEGGRG